MSLKKLTFTSLGTLEIGKNGLENQKILATLPIEGYLHYRIGEYLINIKIMNFEKMICVQRPIL